MLSELINHSDDLRRLRDAGYALRLHKGYLVVDQIPYVTEQRAVARGSLVSKLNIVGNQTAKPDKHEMHFVGSYPCHADGSRMTELVHQETPTDLGDGLVAPLSFSRKPDRDYYLDYFEKVTAYEALLTSQAVQIEDVTARVFGVEEVEDENYPFLYIDTSSARSDINPLSEKLALSSVAIVGLGGTGSFVLDLVAKTFVREIRLIDGDTLANHNVFRAPGAVTLEELKQQPNKAEYFAGVYSKMRRRVVAFPEHLGPHNVNLLDGVDFAFLCFDPSPEKKIAVDALERAGTPFIDVGMGIVRGSESLSGVLSVTLSEYGRREEARSYMAFESLDEDDPYDTNIQVGDLNSLNAALAVVRWKKFYGFYGDTEKERNSTYSIVCNMLEDDIE